MTVTLSQSLVSCPPLQSQALIGGFLLTYTVYLTLQLYILVFTQRPVSVDDASISLRLALSVRTTTLPEDEWVHHPYLSGVGNTLLSQPASMFCCSIGFSLCV